MTDKNSTVVLPEEVENITPGVSSVSGQADLFDEVLSGDIANLRPRVAGDDEIDDPLDAIAREANDDSQEQNRSERNLTSHATTHTGSRRDMDVNGYISDDEETLVTSSGLEERRQVSDIQETGGEVVTQAQSGSVSVDRSEVSVERQEQRSGLVETEDEDNEDADGTDESISVEDQEITAWRGDRRRRDSDEEYTQPDGEESDALVEETLEPEILDAVVLPTEERHADIAPISDGLSALSVAPVTVPETAAGAVVPLTISYEEKDGKEATTFAISLKDAPAGTQVGYRDGKGTFIEVPGGTLDETQVTTAAVKVPAHWSGAFRATVTATSTDAGAPSSAVRTAGVAVNVTPVIDVPDLRAGSDPVTTQEDTVVSLGIQPVSLVDTSETLSVSVSGLPAGAVLGTLAGDVFTPLATSGGPDTSHAVAASKVGTLAVRPPENWSGAFTARVRATVVDTPEGGGNAVTKTVDVPVAVNVTPVIDVPDLRAGSDPVTTQEDTVVSLGIQPVSLVDTS
ncbi:hypothetical protein HEQ72_05995, partial [Haematospirillum sp. 15-248]|uniref:hypothetical protein n=1 Tax=Haematospirillum sp. 15-248 TaxID=2723107 RepID=UPI00143C5F16